MKDLKSFNPPAPSVAFTLRLGTRGSLLARAQSEQIAQELRRLHPTLRVDVQIIKTTGDQIADRPLHELGGKGLFVRELELALLNDSIDLAVHSFKDVPVTMPLVEQDRLTVAAVPPREDPRDVLISKITRTIGELPKSARIGTGSLRRRCQLLAARPDLQIQPLRGNIDTRLRKLQAGEHDAVILALAGLKRAGLFDPSWMFPIDAAYLLPSAGQAALALQCRKADERTINLLSSLHHDRTALCVALEREVVRRLDGDCTSPIAVLAQIDGSRIRLDVAVGKHGGEPPLLRASVEADLASAQIAIDQALRQLSDQGVQSYLHG